MSNRNNYIFIYVIKQMFKHKNKILRVKREHFDVEMSF